MTEKTVSEKSKEAELALAEETFLNQLALALAAIARQIHANEKKDN